MVAAEINGSQTLWFLWRYDGGKVHVQSTQVPSGRFSSSRARDQIAVVCTREPETSIFFFIWYLQISKGAVEHSSSCNRVANHDHAEAQTQASSPRLISLALKSTSNDLQLSQSL